MGVSYGLTRELYAFWRKNGMETVYIRQTQNEVTGEHTAIMLKQLGGECPWLQEFSGDFQRRFMHLMSYQFKHLNPGLSLSILDPNLSTAQEQEHSVVSQDYLTNIISLHDMKRVAAYKSNMVDYHVILDLLPAMAHLFFLRRLPSTTRVSYSQAAILMGLGLQHKTVDQVVEELNIPANQVLALFNKTIRKLYSCLNEIYEKQAQKDLDGGKVQQPVEMLPVKATFAEEVAQEGQKVMDKL